MSDMNKDDDDDCSLSFANFLFGNIDEKGDLVDDFLDEDTRKQLRQLEQLGIGGSLLNDLKREARSNDGGKDDNPVKDSQSDSNLDDKLDNKSQNSDDVDFDVKSPSAIDYSDINEMVEDDEEAKFKEALTILPFKMPTAPVKAIAKPKPIDDDDYDDSSSDEKETDSSQTKDKDSTENDKSSILSPNSQSKDASNSSKKKLDTPLAAMLPSNYEDCNVTDLFPEFRHNKVLRFSRLFGPGKLANLPQIWKNVKSKKNKKKLLHLMAMQNAEDMKDLEVSDRDNSDSDSRRRFFELNIPTTIDPNQLDSDDEERLKKPMQLRDSSGRDGTGSSDDCKPKIADWRYGPAQLWYDMLGVPDSGDTFDYGFKVTEDGHGHIVHFVNLKISSRLIEYSGLADFYDNPLIHSGTRVNV